MRLIHDKLVVRAFIQEEDTKSSGLVDLRCWTRRNNEGFIWISDVRYTCSFSRAGIHYQFTCNNFNADIFNPEIELRFANQDIPELVSGLWICVVRKDHNGVVREIESFNFEMLLHYARFQALLTGAKRDQPEFERISARFDAFFDHQLEHWRPIVRP